MLRTVSLAALFVAVVLCAGVSGDRPAYAQGGGMGFWWGTYKGKDGTDYSYPQWKDTLDGKGNVTLFASQGTIAPGVNLTAKTAIMKCEIPGPNPPGGWVKLFENKNAFVGGKNVLGFQTISGTDPTDPKQAIPSGSKARITWIVTCKDKNNADVVVTYGPYEGTAEEK